jgi:proline iminopeptidase
VNPKDGYFNIQGVGIYYKLYEPFLPNNGRKLICLHGVPGGSHDYLLPLAKLSERGITTLFYDQFGSGRSEESKDFESRLTVDYHVEEAELVRRAAFGNDTIFLIGSSWGGMLALAYAIKYQRHLRGLITTGGLSSVPFHIRELKRIRAELPEQVQNVLNKYENAGDYGNPEYLKAVDYFYKRHLLRLDEWPEEFLKSMKYTEGRRVYRKWWGPNEFIATGGLKDLDFTSRLQTIRIPTLVTTARYDEVFPNVAELIHNNIENSKIVMFEKSSHLPMWEEQDLYLKTVENFIEQH